jgi:beta-lactamase class A
MRFDSVPSATRPSGPSAHGDAPARQPDSDAVHHGPGTTAPTDPGTTARTGMSDAVDDGSELPPFRHHRPSCDTARAAEQPDFTTRSDRAPTTRHNPTAIADRHNTIRAIRRTERRWRCSTGIRGGAAALLAATVLAPLTACAAGHPATSTHATPAPATTAVGGLALRDQLAGLETRFGARLGVSALDTGSGHTVEYRADERFAFCSTIKALQAGAVLTTADSAELDRRITYSPADLLAYAPIARQHVADGMTVRELLDAAVRYSDNTAANLIFGLLGGPQGLQGHLRDLGDQVTNNDRIETALSEATPGDTRDTTTPRTLATDLRSYVLGTVLPASNRALLTTMLRDNTTGAGLIRAGVPAGWTVGDKTGNGDYGTRNDIAVLWPPDRAPIVLAVMSTRSGHDDSFDNALIAQATADALKALG